MASILLPRVDVINRRYPGAAECKIQAAVLSMSVRAAEPPLRLVASGTATGQWNQPRSRLHLVLSAGHEADTGVKIFDTAFDKMIKMVKAAKKDAKNPKVMGRVKSAVRAALVPFGIMSGSVLENKNVQTFLRRLACLVEQQPNLTPKQKRGLATFKRTMLKTDVGRNPCSTSACTTWDHVLNDDPDCINLTDDEKDTLYLESKDQDLFDVIWYWICFFLIWG